MLSRDSYFLVKEQKSGAAKQAHNVIHALELIEQTKDYPPGAQFKWNTEGFWQVEQFYKIATPEQKAEFEQAVHDHRIGVDAMYANLLTGLACNEELLRQLVFSTELNKRCGVKCESMMISDVPGSSRHCWWNPTRRDATVWCAKSGS
jgi:hypothetical protein